MIWLFVLGLGMGMLKVSGADNTWTAQSGNWTTNGNWSEGAEPASGDHDEIYFTNGISANRTVTINADVGTNRVRKMFFNDDDGTTGHNYTLADDGSNRTLTLDYSHDTVYAELGATTNNEGEHTIDVYRIRIDSRLEIYNNSADNDNKFTINSIFETNGEDVIISGNAEVLLMGNITDDDSAGGSSHTNDITITNTGKVTFAGDNENRDRVTLSGGGTLEIQHQDSLGNIGTDTRTYINSGSQLDINITGGVQIQNEDFNVGGTGNGGNGAIRLLSTSGDVEITDEIDMTTHTTFNVEADGDTLTFSGVVDDGGGTAYELTKIGNGKLVLSNTNVYDDHTTVSDGILEIQHRNALSEASTNTTVASGATLSLNFAAGTFDNDSLVIAGDGHNGAGAVSVHASSGNINMTETITLTADSTIAVNNVGGGDDDFETQGVIDDGAGTFDLTKTGSGTLHLGADNNYDGATHINGGTVRISNDNRLGDAPGSATAGHLTFDGGTLMLTTNNSINSNRGIQLNAGGGTLHARDTGETMTYDGILAGSGSLTIVGDGTVDIGGTMNNTGDIIVNAGTLARTSGPGDGDLYIAEGAGVTQAVSVVSGGDITVADELYMGGTSTSTASLVLNGSGSTINVTDEAFIAAGTSSVAFVTVESGASMTIGNTTRIGQYGTATVLITGSGSSFTQSSNKLSVGGSDSANGNGLLRIENGALLTHTAGSTFEIGERSDSIGSVVITGAGTTALLENVNVGEVSALDNQFVVSNSATVTFTDFVTMGKDANSNGSMTVASGASLSMTGAGTTAFIGNAGTGSLTVTGSGTRFTATDDEVRVGNGTTGIGTLTVTSGAGMTANSMIVENTGSAVSTRQVSVGASGSTDDELNIASSLVVTDSATLTLENGYDLYVGQAAGEVGVMTVSNGADIATGGAGGTVIGQSGTGTLLLTGSGSTFTSNFLRIGNNTAASNGTVTIAAGAQFTTSANHVYVGATGTGVLTVTGAGSKLTSAQNLFIGQNASANGVLNINSNGEVSVGGTIYVGNATGGTATLNLNTNDGIIDGSNMELGGGTFNTDGNDQASGGLGTLTMSATSTIDVGAGSIINWAVLDEANFTGTLNIHNWSSGRHNASGSDQLIFADHAGFAHSTHGYQIKFYSDAGSTLVGSSGYFIGNSLVAAPEPGTWIGIVSLGIFGVYYEIRRRRKNQPCSKA